MASTGNNGNSTGQSATSAQAAAAAGNAAASNAANSGTSNSSGNTSTNTSTGATNAAGLNVTSESDAQSAAQKGNAEKSNSSNSMFPGGIPGLGGESYQSWQSNQSSSNEVYGPSNSLDAVISGLLSQPTRTESRKGFIGAFAKDIETPANHKTQMATQRNNALRKAYNVLKNGGTIDESVSAYALSGPFHTGWGRLTRSAIDYDQTNADMETLYSINNNNNTTPAATTNSFTPAATTNSFTPVSAPSDNSTSETATPSVSESFSDASNTGLTYRGGTVSTPSGTSVTDSGTGGSISSSITPPSRDASSIGLGVYNNDRANYDQDNWNRGMESESSSLVSDEECKAFAKRAFMENSEPFKKVRITIIKKC